MTILVTIDAQSVLKNHENNLSRSLGPAGLRFSKIRGKLRVSMISGQSQFQHGFSVLQVLVLVASTHVLRGFRTSKLLQSNIG